MLRATLLLLLLAGCAAKPAPEALSTAHICKNEALRAMQSSQADNTTGAVYYQTTFGALYERCIAERETPRPAELSLGN